MSEQQNVKYKYSGDSDKLGYIAQLTADNARLRKAIEEVDMHCDGCSIYLKEPCDCGFDEWKRNALEGK